LKLLRKGLSRFTAELNMGLISAISEANGKEETTTHWSFTTSGKSLMAFVDDLMVVAEEAKLELLANGISAKAVDASHVMMMSTTIGNGKETGLTAGIELSDLRKTLIGHIKTDKLKVTLSYNNDGMMEVDLGDGTTFSLRCLDETKLTSPNFPENLNFSTSVEVEGKKAQLAMTRVHRVRYSYLAELTISKDLAVFKGMSDNKSRTIKTKIAGKTRDKKTSKAVYSVSYLYPLFKAWGKSSSIEMKSGNDYPLQCVKKITIHGVDIESQAFLAPRVDPDDQY
jgi:hypothetical protein